MVLLCYDASESRRGAVLLRPFRGRDQPSQGYGTAGKIAPLHLVAAEPRQDIRATRGGWICVIGALAVETARF